jgi:23S rRNA (cytosine1962-C5)-methyltransferase
MQTLVLAKDVSRAIREGHPWVYARALHPARRPAERGELVEVAARGETLAVGFADPDGPIAVRVLERGGGARIDDAWVRARVARACAIRRGDPALAATDACRLLHGENDFTPGLVLDRYRATGVISFDGAAAAAMWRPRLAAIAAGCGEAGFALDRIWERPLPGDAAGEGSVASGDAPPDAIRIEENGARFEIDVRRGQKTGFYLDQRDNRLRLRALTAGADVLNLFCYTGGFSVHAALGGARRVTSVDRAAPAVAAAVRNVALNDLAADAHDLVAEDAFAYLERAVAQDRRWEVVVCDPPSFAPSEKARPAALRAYRRLNRLALAAVGQGGRLVTASCSSHVTDADLIAAIAGAAADLDRRVRITAVTGAASDHPVAPAFPEGRYLTCLWAVAD